MEDFKMPGEKIEALVMEALPKVLADKFTDSYSSPLKTVVEEEIKNQDGAIRELVKSIIISLVKDDILKTKITDAIIAKILQKGMNL